MVTCLKSEIKESFYLEVMKSITNFIFVHITRVGSVILMNAIVLKL